MALEDPKLNHESTLARAEEFLAQCRKNPEEVRYRRLATLRIRRDIPISTSVPILPAKPDLPVETPPVPIRRPSASDPPDDPDYNRKICDTAGRRTALFYSKLRCYRPFRETRIVLCKCARCRAHFKGDLTVGDDELVRDIDSESLGLSGDHSPRLSPTQLVAESAEEAELLAEIKNLAMENLDDWVTTTRTLKPHSVRTIAALTDLLAQCHGDCALSENTRKAIEQNARLWLQSQPDAPGEEFAKQKRSRRERASYVSEAHPEDLKRNFFDPDYFPKRSAYRLNFMARKSLYRVCSDNDWIAPILVAQNEKGRAVFAAAVIYKGDFVCEYKGVFYSQYGIARAKEQEYSLLGKGSFMFYFPNPFTGSTSCIDATAECPLFGPARLINHSHRRPNLEATVVTLDGHNDRERRARLVFFASRDIRIGEELLIDYGENKPTTLEQNAWLYD
eukprot:Protomagalhaensia_sp_Gyna_25__5116@NODE_591_length_3048_cov_9_802925_g458_i0_p1_GENE_NODE_591_length_3048_cov_9_802925_g458_i0NODE_591_length_3048_cov_9_802925_g458_i0_p1_ORF_typecomplete_len499_score73_30SET/PF00856_28/1e03SET/PF00856_28/3_2e15Rhomboid_N/PF12122_8/0_51Rhomboid_N/PF12122_8/4_5e02_NODE_591_length_3048_cov_9_802925_g458_i01521498